MGTIDAQPATPPTPAQPAPKIPTLTIPNLPEPKTTFVLAAPGTWKQELYLFADGEGQVVVGDIVHVQRFQAAGGGQQVEVRPTKPTPAVLTHGGVAAFTLEATFTAANTYSTALTVVYGARTLSRTIVVEVASAATARTVPVEQLDPKTFSVGPGVSTIKLRLANTGDAPQTLALDADHAEVHLVRGVVAKLATGATGWLVPPKDVNTVTIPPRDTAELTVRLEGLEAGEYAGSVRIIGDGAPPTQLQFVANARRDWPCALILIIIGVFAGAIVAYWRDHQRKRKVLRITIAQLRARLDPRALQVETSLALGVLRAIEQMLVDVERDVGLEGSAGTAETRLKDHAKRIGLFEAFNAAANAATQLPPADQLIKRGELDKVAVYLRDPEASLDGVRKMLDDLGVLAAERTALSTALESLAGTIAELRKSRDTMLDQDLRAADERIALARDARRRDATNELREHIETARREVARVALAAIGRALADVTRPNWADAGAWTKLRDEVAGLTTKDGVERYHQAREIYLRGAAAEALRVAGAMANPSEAQKAAVTALTTADNATPVDLDNLSRRLRELVAFFPTPSAQVRKLPPDAVTASRGGEAGDAFGGFGRLPVLDGVVSPDELARNVLIRDVAVYILVGIIAVLGGLKVLWVNDTTWGTTEDIITALIWGAGFKPVADGFLGLFGLRDAIGKAG